MKKILIIAVTTALVASGFVTSNAVAAPLAKCKSCHTFKSGGKHMIGPNLFNIVGRVMGDSNFKKYGSYLKAQNSESVSWDAENLRPWLYNSKKVAKAAGFKTRMPAQKLKGEKLDAVIEALKALR